MSGTDKSAASSKRLYAAILVVLALSGCDAKGPPAHVTNGQAIVERAIVGPVLSLDSRDPSEFFDVETVVDWTFGDERKAVGWTLSGEGNGLVRKGDRLHVVCSSRPCRLTAETDLLASEVDALEVRMSGARSVSFAWATNREEADRERRLNERFWAAREAGTVRFDLAREEDWSGRITRLEIEPVPIPGQPVQAFSVLGLKYRVSETGTERLVNSPWRVTLADEARPALLAVPGRPIEWSATVPRGATLRFGTAVPESWSEGASLEVVARVRGEERSLFAEQRSPSDGWQEHDVDLGDLGGGEVTFEFRTSSDQIDPILGFAAWSSPEITAPSTTQMPNVVLVSIDTLRVDHLSLAGYNRETSPNIDRFFADRGVWLRNTVTSAPWTLPAHVSLVTGVDALAHGVNHKRAMPASLETLAQRLKTHGFHTVGVTGGGWLSGRYGFDRGFDRYRSWPLGQPRKRELEEHVDQLVDWLPNAREPFFLFFHTFEVHSPHDRRNPFTAPGGPTLDRVRFFDSPVEARREAGYTLEKKLLVGERPTDALEVASKEDWQSAIAAYDNGIRYMDEQIGRLLNALDDLGPTVVVLTSDHGESLGEHDLASHGYLYDHNLLVPLVIAAPGEDEAGRAIDRQVRLVDVAPTILDYAGIQPPTGIDGRSLRRLVATGRDEELPRIATSYASSSNLGLSLRTDNRLKYIFNNTPWPPIAGAERLYDLRADPGEISGLDGDAAGDEFERQRRQAATALERRTPHPLLELRNDGMAVFSGTLTGSCMQPLRVTSPTAGSAEIVWIEAGKAGFSLRPGEAISLALEEPAAGCVAVVGRVEGVDELNARVDDPDSVKPFGWSLSEGQFMRIAKKERLSVGFWWIPAAMSRTDVDPATDATVRGELKALGYLN